MRATPHYPALVLNADYAPLQIWPLLTWDLMRTMRNVLKERVTVVSTYDTILRSARHAYAPPSVVALKSYVKVPERVAFNRTNILIRDNFSCQYCGSRLKLNEMTFDHVVPRSHGGPTNFENIVSCCASCNSKKGNKASIRPKKMPTRPDPRDMLKRQPVNVESLHQTWIDCLYWSGVLEQN